MPLSAPAPRQHLHTRTVTCQGFRREDGLWDIEGHITDVKTYPFPNEHRGTIEPGDPIHGMWLRLTLDNDFTVRAVEAVTDKAPFGVCGAITPSFQRLLGLRIGPGWTRAVKERLSGVEGCTHLVELLGPVATTAFQTIYPALSRERAETGGPKVKARPPMLDTCHALASDGEVVQRHWPEFFKTPSSRDEAAD
ncbi:MAG TPA: DUF2889 domain-containing protein [Azospirillaceae bacterium]|nr:DUF2889 domain-containing protein [Azospirillaceae bacterium]